MSKQKELTPAMRTVLELMAKGWSLSVGLSTFHPHTSLSSPHWGERDWKVSRHTVHALAERGLIKPTRREFPTLFYGLTETGKQEAVRER
jgi:hypothetical protein